MEVIRSTELFFAITRYNTGGDNGAFQMLLDDNGETKDYRIPHLLGGLDRVVIKKKGVYFYDIGCNGKDNSFVIRPEL